MQAPAEPFRAGVVRPARPVPYQLHSLDPLPSSPRGVRHSVATLQRLTLQYDQVQGEATVV